MCYTSGTWLKKVCLLSLFMHFTWAIGFVGMWLGLTTTHLQTWLFSSSWGRPPGRPRNQSLDQLSAKFHYTDPTGPDQTRQSPHTLSETRVSDKIWSGPSSGIWLLETILPSHRRLLEACSLITLKWVQNSVMLGSRIKILCNNLLLSETVLQSGIKRNPTSDNLL